MSFPEAFWYSLTMAGVVWYLTVTVYVAIKGAFDIRTMLKSLEEQHRQSNSK
jgi:hypothetical protein